MTPQLTPVKKRIEYIDLMKGFCIILVVLYHCSIRFNVDIIDKALGNFRMPLYFFLSGLFFKTYSGFWEFMVRKINRLLVPYLFFAYIPFYLIDLLIHRGQSFPYFLVQIVAPYNFTLWFLKSLFCMSLSYYAYRMLMKGKSDLIGAVVMFLVACSAYFLSEMMHNSGKDLILPLRLNLEAIITSFFLLPFMWIGHQLASRGFLSMKFSNRFLIVLFALFLAFWLICSQDNVRFSRALFGDIPFLTVTCAFSGIGVCWVICYKLKHLPFVSYVGRYSIIVFGTHVPYILLLKEFGTLPPFVNALITLALMPPTIWFFKKYFPRFVAQKDLFPVPVGTQKTK